MSANPQPARSAAATPPPAAAAKPAAGQLSPGRPLLEAIEVDYGPRELFSRFFLEAVAAARAEGVELAFATLADLLEVNRRNSTSWMPLFPVFDHRNGVSDTETFCFLGRNRSGEVIATQAARLYVWTDTDLVEEATSLRLLYKDPERMRLPGETLTIDAPNARQIFGRAVFSGAVWNRPDYRKGILSSLLPRICRTYAHTRWFADYVFSFMSKKVVAGGVAERVGYRHVEGDVVLRNPTYGAFDASLIWMQPDYLVEDLEAYLARLKTQIDPVVHRRSA